MRSVDIEKKIEALGLELPEVPQPVASYIPAVHSGNYVFTSGQLPVIKGELKRIFAFSLTPYEF